MFHPRAPLSLPLGSIALAAALCISPGAHAGSVRLSMVGAPTNAGADLSGSLMIDISTPDATGDGRSVDITFSNFAMGVATLSGISVEGAPVLEGRLVSLTGPRYLTARSDSDAGRTNSDRGAPVVDTRWSRGTSDVQTQTWRYSLKGSTSFEDVVAAITGTGAADSGVKVNVRTRSLIDPFRLGSGDEYRPNAVLVVPLPASTYAGVGTLAGIVGLMYVRRRGHARG